MSSLRVDVNFQLSFNQNMGTETFAQCWSQLGVEITEQDFSLVLYFGQQLPLAGSSLLLNSVNLKIKKLLNAKKFERNSDLIIFLCHSDWLALLYLQENKT